MTRQRSMIEALIEIESVLEELVRMPDEDGNEFLGSKVLEKLHRSVDALVLGELLQVGMTEKLRLVLSSLERSGEEFMQWEAFLDETGLENEASLRAVMAQFIRRNNRFRHLYWDEFIDYKSVGWIRLKPHLLEVVREALAG